MTPNKCLLLLLDGLGDRQYFELNHQTPLQAAHTPNLDYLARLGGNGLFHAGYLGEPFPSENAHFALFGYPQSLFPGRGPLEALGAGIELQQNEVAVLAHFVSAQNRNNALYVLSDQPKSKDKHEVSSVFDLVGCFEHQGIKIRIQQTKGLFGVLILQGEVSAQITDSNPMRDQALASNILALAGTDENAQATASALRAYLSWAFQRLDRSEVNKQRKEQGLLPINALVTQRAGQMQTVPDFTTRTGLKGISIASGAMFHGLARLTGMHTRDVPKQENPESDFSARLDLAARLLPEYDFFHVHTKAPDQAAHTKDCRAKQKVIEDLDRALTRHMPLLAHDPRILTIVASDHSTPSKGSMIHSGEAVPVIMRAETVRRDHVSVYDEISAAYGCLGLMRNTELMRMMLNALDRAKLHGIREVPQELLYWPAPTSGLPLDP